MMGVHGIAEAADRLSELIDCALAGDTVITARDDRSMVELTAPKLRSEPIIDGGTLVPDLPTTAT